ncbi:hypothetical protein BV349_04633 [Pseudomonas syringae pv. actinidiae]|uniref:hypothetical protein n=1 Tax=Pseudomonas syringae TaxID=317 RepID=UPI000A1FE3F5|nr:hypothetical protein [Pseudomonas syringae]OSN63085.1 hypothetical protein BV349_04633 [Pseudomonas syringae pv. actinidiae]OSN75480.1 hypothetical protein BV351_03657 [Pseudomonas syringae pv. actinidiae]
MAQFHDNEILRSNTAGQFRPHSLITKIFPDGDISLGDDAQPAAVALHVHEYIHYLHNLSTIPGLGSLTSSFLLMQSVLKATLEGSPGCELFAKSDAHAHRAFAQVKLMRGFTIGIPKDYRWGIVSKWEFTELKATPKLPDGLDKDDLEDQVFYEVSATFSDGRILNFDLLPSLDFISEGIAYEIERDILKRSGKSSIEVDLGTPSFPYLAYGPLLESLVGRAIPSDERLFLGAMALLTRVPSAALNSLCRLHHYEEDTLASHTFQDMVHRIIQDFKGYSDYVTTSIIPTLYGVLGTSDILEAGMQVYERLITKGLETRARNPFLESAFLDNKMDVIGFNKVAAKYLERMTFQEKHFGEAEISWIGEKGSVVSMPAQMHDAFAALQSCIHYVQQHFASDVLQVSCRPLGQVQCPYSGACSVEVDRGHPQACKSEPWKSQADEPLLKCVYQVGVEAFYQTIAK